MISDRAKVILSEGVEGGGEPEVIFLEEEAASVVFRLFRASDHAGTRSNEPSDGWAEPEVCVEPPAENSGPG